MVLIPIHVGSSAYQHAFSAMATLQGLNGGRVLGHGCWVLTSASSWAWVFTSHRSGPRGTEMPWLLLDV